VTGYDVTGSEVSGCDVTRSVLALDRRGSAFYVPRWSLRPFDDSSDQPWFFPTPLSPHQATLFVAAQRKNGCFIVYKPAVEERSMDGRPEYVLAVGLSQGENQGQIQTVSSKNVNFLDPGTGPHAPPMLFLFFLVLLLSDLRSAKAFSFHNRSSPNFANTLVTTLLTIVP